MAQMTNTEMRYRVTVVSMHQSGDGEYDFQHENYYATLDEARAAYEAETLGTETDKMLVDEEADEVLAATNDALI